MLSITMHKISFRFLIVLLALSFTGLVAAAPPLMSAAQLNELQTKAQSQGGIRVIVQLSQIDTQLRGINTSQFEQRKQRITAVQDRIVNQLSTQRVFATKKFREIPFMVIETDAPGFSQLAKLTDVASIIEDKIVPPSLADSVPLIGADIAQNLDYSGVGQAVAILDTGVQTDHPFFQGRVTYEACFSTTSTVNNSTTLCPSGLESEIGPGSGINCDNAIAQCFHGTHVAGIAAGGGSTLNGVAPGASIMSFQVYSRFDGTVCTNFGLASPCVLSYTSDQIEALLHVYSIRNTYAIASVNMSLGGGQYFSAADCDAANVSTKNAIDLLRSADIASVISSGNSGFIDSLGSPGCISTAISVGATDKSDVVAGFSNSASWLSLLAPGVFINSSVPNSGYGTASGTSMAAPHVAGAWAVLKSKFTDASVDEILNMFRSTGIGILDARNGLTVPRIQVDNALLSYDTLAPGFNMLGIGIDTATVPDAYTLLSQLGPDSDIERIERFNSAMGVFETTYYDAGGSPAGDNPALTSGDGWLVYALNRTRVVNDPTAPCTNLQLQHGMNLVAFPCLRSRLSAFELLQTSNDLTLVQIYNRATGRFMSATKDTDGSSVGDNFPIQPGNAYIVNTQNAIVLPGL
jgi:subtilisin family serine protease